MSRKKYFIVGIILLLGLTLAALYFYLSRENRYMEKAFGRALNYFLQMHYQNSHVYGALTHEEYKHLDLHLRMESRMFMAGGTEDLEFLRKKVASPTKLEDEEIDKAIYALTVLKEINSKESWQIIESFSNHPDEYISAYVRKLLEDKPTKFDEFSGRGNK